MRPIPFVYAVRDVQTITAAKDAKAMNAAVATLRRTWALTWGASVLSLDDAGADLMAFTAFPPVHWRCLRATNVIKRIFDEFKRRTKVRRVFPTLEAMLAGL